MTSKPRHCDASFKKRFIIFFKVELQEYGRETERSFSHWFIPQMATVARAGLVRSQGLLPSVPHGSRNSSVCTIFRCFSGCMNRELVQEQPAYPMPMLLAATLPGIPQHQPVMLELNGTCSPPVVLNTPT